LKDFVAFIALKEFINLEGLFFDEFETLDAALFSSLVLFELLVCDVLERPKKLFN